MQPENETTKRAVKAKVAPNIVVRDLKIILDPLCFVKFAIRKYQNAPVAA
jgi:hypothetical protein